MTTANTACTCGFNQPSCDTRARRGLLRWCSQEAKAGALADKSAPTYMTRDEAYEYATKHGGVPRVGLHGLCGTARKWYVAA